MPRSPGASRDLTLSAIVRAAIEVMEDVGETDFSLRKVAAALGRDAMSVTYHVGSREGLERAMAEHLDARVRPGPSDVAWRPRLRHLADQYRAVALSHPQSFPLLQRFSHTGPAEHVHSEAVMGALAQAGVSESRIPAVALGWFACVIGLAVGEVRGLVAPTDDHAAAEIAALPSEEFPLTTRLLPAHRELAASEVFHTTLELLLSGIAAEGAATDDSTPLIPTP